MNPRIAAGALLLFLCFSQVKAAPLKLDESIVFLSGIGNSSSNGWDLQIHGWIYESNYHKPVTSLLRRALGIRDDELTPGEQATFRERAQYFLVDNERRKSISIAIGNAIYRLSSSSANGHFLTNLHLGAKEVEILGLSSLLTNRVVPFQTISENKKVAPVNGSIDLIPATGISVISDIDDTIKISEIGNRKELLRNTFCRSFVPVPEMAGLYRSWETNAGARFHYVSASPWQLYVPLSQFVQSNNFPAGTFHLKQFRWKDQSFYDLFKSPEKYKRATIEPLLKQFPERKFVLVGDSGEKDPEIYAAFARRFPAQITGVFIRDVTGESSAAPRYKSAFSDVSSNLWHIFQSATNLPARLP